MKWGVYAGFFGLSMIKFLFAPLGGPKAGLTFLETYLACVSGAVFSAAIFYFSSEFFMIRAHKKRKRLLEASIASGVPLKFKRKFTWSNKLIVRVKHTLGIFGTSMFVPLFLSIPIGSIITAKFFGKDKRTFPLILLGIFINGAILTTIGWVIDYSTE